MIHLRFLNIALNVIQTILPCAWQRKTSHKLLPFDGRRIFIYSEWASFFFPFFFFPSFNWKTQFRSQRANAVIHNVDYQYCWPSRNTAFANVTDHHVSCFLLFFFFFHCEREHGVPSTETNLTNALSVIGISVNWLSSINLFTLEESAIVLKGTFCNCSAKIVRIHFLINFVHVCLDK